VGQGPGLGGGELGDGGYGVSTAAEEDLGSGMLDEGAEGVKILGGVEGEAGAEVSGLGWGRGGGVAAGSVEEDDRGGGQDGGQVDLTEETAGGSDERFVGTVFLEAGVHAEDSEEGSGG
jgi:hypothetical protein